MHIVTHRKIYYFISFLLLAASIAAIGIWGLNPGIDFKGGSVIEVEYKADRPTLEQVNAALSTLSLGGTSVRPVGDKGYIVRTRHLSESERTPLLTALSLGKVGNLDEKRFDSVGPLLGKEARNKSVAAIILVLVIIVLFITFVFRKVSEPVSSWKYGLIAIFALLHDVIIPTGAFAVLGHFKGYEIDTLFITALLVILGFSIHDTIVVFDRVREHLRNRSGNTSFEQIVGDSIGETFTRSINTSLTVILTLLAMYFVGPESTKAFILALLIGIIAGTYSSIFLGSPLLVTVEKWQNRNAGTKRKK